MTTTINIREAERNWLEKIKRKHELKTLSEVVERIRKLFSKLKLEGELK